MKFRHGLSPTSGLLLLSALWAFGWSIGDLFPHSGGNAVPLPVGQAILFSSFTVMSFFISAVRKLNYPGGRSAWACIGIGVGLFVIPITVAGLAQSWISSLDEVAVLCLTTVFAVILEPHFHEGVVRTAKFALPAALAALAGILLFFPLERPDSIQAGVALLALLVTAFEVAVTSCVAVQLAPTVSRHSVLPMATQAMGGSAVCFAVIAVVSRQFRWNSIPLQIYVPRLCLIDLPGLFLLFWLIKRLPASRITARFLMAPLFASLGGLAQSWTVPSSRGLIGILLLASGSGWLVFAPDEMREEEPITIKNLSTALVTPPRTED